MAYRENKTFYEVGFAKDADMMPPEGYDALLEGPCLN
jgi:hypothetical protein